MNWILAYHTNRRLSHVCLVHQCHSLADGNLKVVIWLRPDPLAWQRSPVNLKSSEMAAELRFLERRAHSAALLQVGALQPVDLTRMLWGYARLEHPPGTRLFQAAASHLLGVLPTCPAPLLYRLLWSFRRFQVMGFHEDSVMVAIAQELPRAAQYRDHASECSW